jgi:hypothetical protein
MRGDQKKYVRQTPAFLNQPCPAQSMIWVTEYGKHIGTIRNCFKNHEEAEAFVIDKVIGLSDCRYEQISNTQWICLDKDEAIEIEII